MKSLVLLEERACRFKLLLIKGHVVLGEVELLDSLAIFQSIQYFGKTTALHAILAHVEEFKSSCSLQSLAELNCTRLFYFAIADI